MNKIGIIGAMELEVAELKSKSIISATILSKSFSSVIDTSFSTSDESSVPIFSTIPKSP